MNETQARPGQDTEALERDYDIRIARDGTWYHEGAPIARKGLCKLFSSVLRREADGTYWLVTPAERGRIAVEETPFVAVEVDSEGQGEARRLVFRTNLEDTVSLDESHPLRVEPSPITGEKTPYLLVRDGLEARVLRSVYYHLVELGEERAGVDGSVDFGVRSAGRFFPLGTLAEE